MPIYEYHCDGCGKDFESLVFGSDKLGNCPLCNSVKVNKLMSACGFLSKGSGGETVKSSGSSSSCGSCASSNCSSCGH